MTPRECDGRGRTQYRAPMKNFTVLAIVALLAAFGLAACGGDGETASSAASEVESVIGGGTAECNQVTFDAWAKAYGESNGTTVTLDKDAFTCADGWAVMFPTVGEGDEAFTETVVVQAEGPAWALMDRSKVCGDSAENSEVPADLYQDACQTN